MARGDLFISLVRSSMSGDKKRLRSTVETIFANGYPRLCAVYKFDEGA
jgi:hypothetical protein